MRSENNMAKNRRKCC